MSGVWEAIGVPPRVMHHAWKLLPLTAIVVAGSLGAGAASAQAAPTTAQFAKRADSICRAYTHKLDAVEKPTSAAGVTRYLERSLEAAAPGVKRLRALALPSERRAEARRAVTYVGKEVTVIRAAIKALKGGAAPLPTLNQFVKQSEKLSKTEDRAWRAVGATDCAKD